MTQRLLRHYTLGMLRFHPVYFLEDANLSVATCILFLNVNCTCLEAQIHCYILPFIFDVSTA